MMTEEEIKEFLRGAGKDKDSIKKVRFKPLSPGKGLNRVKTSIRHLEDVRVTIIAELGQTTIKVREILALTEGSVIELDRPAGDAVEIYINDQKFGRGEVMVINDIFALRIIKVYPPLIFKPEEA